MELEEIIFLRNIKCIDKELDMNVFGVVDYSAGRYSGHIIALQDQACCVPELSKYL